MTDHLSQALARFGSWLGPQVQSWLEPRLEKDQDLREAVAGIATAVFDWVEELNKESPEANESEADGVPGSTPTVPPPPAEPPVPISELPELRIGAHPPPPAPLPTTEADRDLDLLPLSVVADRCRVKGEACKQVAKRVADPVGWRDTDAEADLTARAYTLPDCNLWMLTRDPVVTAAKAWYDLAGAFATAADAALMLHMWEQAPAPLADRHASRVLGLAAESQSVLLYAVADVRDVKVDFDQVQLFAHVRTVARNRQIFIPKYLKREDRAAPESWPDVARRVADLSAEFRAVGDRDKARVKALNNVRFKLNRLRTNPETSAGEWPRVIELVDELVAGGMPASNAELREMLLPVYEDIPDDPPPPPTVGLVLREIDRYLETRPDDDPPARQPHPSAEVAEVADLLRGREVVLIGGQARPVHKAALTKAFDLADVRWVCTPDHTSFTVFEPDIARPEVAVVLLAIRWSNHDYDNVQKYCEEYGKPLVRLPGGYNANTVAYHILTQAGARLRAARAAAG